MNWRPPCIAALSFIILLVTSAVVIAQSSASVSCPALVTQALQVVSDVCAGQGGNSACYGNTLVEAKFAGDADPVSFSRQGDLASLNQLVSIRTSPLSEDLAYWGVSLLSVQANLPGTLPGQNALFMLLGGAEIESAVAQEALFVPRDPIPVLTSANAPVFDAPQADATVVFTTSANQALLADAVTKDGAFVRVTLGQQYGWIAHASLLQDGSLDVLPIYTPGESFAPMQAFRLRSGVGSAQCAEAPSALVVQGPHEYTVTLNVNGATISLGSTLIFENIPLAQVQSGASAGPSGLLRVSVLDGHALIANPDGTITEVREGYQSRIFLVDDAAGSQIITTEYGGWSAPQPIADEFRWRYRMLNGVTLHYPLNVISAEAIAQRQPIAATPAPAAIVSNPAPAVPAAPPPAPANSSGSMTICHNWKNTLTLPQHSALNHLATHAGDYPGPCINQGGGNGNSGNNGNGNGNGGNNGNRNGNGGNNGNNGNGGGNGNGRGG